MRDMTDYLREDLDSWTAKIAIGIISTYSILLGFILYKLTKPLVDLYGSLFVAIFIYTIMIILLIMLMRHKRKESYTKKLKTGADVAWNIWSFSAIIIASLSTIDKTIIDALTRHSPYIFALVFGVILPAAALKIAVSTVEHFNWDRPAPNKQT